MDYKIVKSDELYHFGVKGMKWGVRKLRQAGSEAGRKERISKAAKIGTAVAVTAVAAYGGYKVYKLHGDAVTSLGKKYARMASRQFDIGQNRSLTANNLSLDANIYKRRAAEELRAGNKDWFDIYKNMQANAHSASRKLEKQARDAYNLGAEYSIRSRSGKYAKKEVAREMINLSRNRRNR